MRKKLLQIVLVLVALCQTAAFAQTSRVTGKVIGADNQPVAGASIMISGTTIGTITDADGNYGLQAPAGASLLINSIGFADQVVKVDGRSSINVQLSSGQSAGLDEVVVTGYTAQRKKDIVGSVAVVNVAALKSLPAGSAESALQGQASGVNVVNSGSPGAPSLIFIRGLTGFANTPLVLIDGVQGLLNDVPSSDVESIQVLKDAGAASIYGARGANGVIIVTTKKGKSGASSITYDTYFNFQVPHKGSDLNTINAQQYASIYKTLNAGSGIFVNGALPDYFYRSGGGRGSANEGNPVINPSLYNFDPANTANNYIIAKVNKNGQGGDVYNSIFNPALMMNHNITASGGTDRANYLLSLGYLDQEGTLKNSYLKRYTARINTQFKLRDNIRLGENLNIFYKDNPGFSQNGGFGPIQQAANQIPFLPSYDIKGQYAGAYSGPKDDLGDWGNSLADVTLTNNNRSRSYGLIGNAFLEIDFLKHFTARTSIGGAITNGYDQTYKYNQYWTSSGGGNNSLTENSGYATTAQWTNSLAYKNEFGKHNVSVLVGTESIENKSRSMNAVGEKFLSDDYNYLVLANAQIPKIPTSRAASDGLFSQFGRLDYSYNDRYLLTVTVRRDGFSNFGPNKQYGVFPAVAAGWRISQENFMKNVTWINDLKIRASYGILGNKEAAPYGNAYTTFAQGPRFSYYDITGSGNSIVQGFYPSRNGNAYTSWEKDKMMNLGFDASLFRNKIDLSIEYYQKKIDGLLRQAYAPATAGEASSPVINFGDIRNRGVDINVAYHAKISNDFQFNVGVNFTTYKNLVLALPDPKYADEGIVRHQVGHSLGEWYGYRIIGIYNDTNQVKSGPVQQDAAPGRYRYQDVDGNDTINDKDRTYIGNPNPKFTMGVNLSATFKHFDFSAVLYTSQGNDLYNNQLEYLGSFERGPGNKSKRVLDAWTPEHMNTKIKKNELSRNFSNSGVNNSDFIEDGSFIRLRSVQIGYTLQSTRMKGMGLSRLRFYIQGSNLFTITKYKGLDPEVSGTGIGFMGQDAGAYVQEKGVVLGLNVTF